MSDEYFKAEADAVRDMVLAQNSVQHIDLSREGTVEPVAILPPGYRAETFDSNLPNPRRVQQRVGLLDRESFLSYFERFAYDASAVFINEPKAAYSAVFDYHEKGRAHWGDHSAIFQLKDSPEFMTWLNYNRQWMDQVDLAEFIEDNIEDVDGDAAGLLESVTNMQQVSNVRFRSKVDLVDGSMNFAFEQDAAQGSIAVPETFVLRINAFERLEKYQLQTKLRYRIKGGDLRMRFVMDRPDVFKRLCLEAETAAVKAALPSGSAIFMGSRG